MLQAEGGSAPEAGASTRQSRVGMRAWEMMNEDEDEPQGTAEDEEELDRRLKKRRMELQEREAKEKEEKEKELREQMQKEQAMVCVFLV